MTENDVEGLAKTCEKMRSVDLSRGPDVRVFSYDDVQTVRAGCERLLEERFVLRRGLKAISDAHRLAMNQLQFANLKIKQLASKVRIAAEETSRSEVNEGHPCPECECDFCWQEED